MTSQTEYSYKKVFSFASEATENCLVFLLKKTISYFQLLLVLDPTMFRCKVYYSLLFTSLTSTPLLSLYNYFSISLVIYRLKEWVHSLLAIALQKKSRNRQRQTAFSSHSLKAETQTFSTSWLVFFKSLQVSICQKHTLRETTSFSSNMQATNLQKLNRNFN